MKNTVLIVSVILALACSAVFAQTTEFTYQGSLKNGANPASGNYDFEFALFDTLAGGAQVGSTLTRSSVAVADGTFSVKLDFGSNFPGANRFLEIRVRSTGGGAFTPLAPRQPVTSAPYSVKSLNADQLGGFTAEGFIRNQAGMQLATFNVSGNGIIGGNAGIGTSEPAFKLHVDDVSNTGLRVTTNTFGGTVATFGGRGAFQIDAEGVVGGRFTALENGNVGIGNPNPIEKLSVNGTIQSTTGGFKFPDGSVQTSASALGPTIYTTKQTADLPMVGWGGPDTTVAHLNLPNGVYHLSATVNFRNEANFFGQENHRFFLCKFSAEPGGDDRSYSYNESIAGLFTLTTTFHSIVTVSNGGVDLLCRAFYNLPTSVIVQQRRMTAVPITGTLIVQ